MRRERSSSAASSPSGSACATTANPGPSSAEAMSSNNASAGSASGTACAFSVGYRGEERTRCTATLSRSSEEQRRINSEPLGKRLDMPLAKVALPGQHPRYHRLGADLGQVRDTQAVLVHDETHDSDIRRAGGRLALEFRQFVIATLVVVDRAG